MKKEDWVSHHKEISVLYDKICQEGKIYYSNKSIKIVQQAESNLKFLGSQVQRIILDNKELLNYFIEEDNNIDELISKPEYLQNDVDIFLDAINYKIEECK